MEVLRPIGEMGGGNDAQENNILAQLEALKKTIQHDQNRIRAMEEKISSLEQPRWGLPQGDPTAHTEITSDSDLNQDFMFLSSRKTIPSVRECTFAEFKNRFDPCGKDGYYAVDVLVSGALLRQEIQEEQRLREKLFAQPTPASSGRVSKDKTLGKAVKMANTTADLISQAQGTDRWPRRIRIQSPALLQLLAGVNREKWSNRPRTYSRPFLPLIHQHHKMRNVLSELEGKWGSHLDGHVGSENDEQSEDTETDSNFDSDAESDSVHDSPKTLACLRAYMRYFDEKIMPDYHRLDNMNASSNAKVRFSDLCYLFRTGELVYRHFKLTDRRRFGMGKRIWKTYHVHPVSEHQVAAAADDQADRDNTLDDEETAFEISCYYVDHTGDEFCVVKQDFKIEQFDGEVFVGRLPVYPLRFSLDSQNRLEKSIQMGESLIKLMKIRHCSYDGWTLTRSPNGDPTAVDASGAHSQQSEHVSSEVMIDFNEAFQHFPAWLPVRAQMPRKSTEDVTATEGFRIRWWSGPDRATLLGETTELLPSNNGVARRQRNKFLSEDPFLVAVSENLKHRQPTTEKHLTQEAKALLTGRVFAYIFQERKFAQLAVSELRPSPKTGLALELLKIPQTIKHTIQGSVQGHFLQKRAEQRLGQSWVSLDVIQGKGTGLFILLHGVPGVGKTATAEAIAQTHGKPLFKITVGDLGLTPEKLESSLREIFRLASIWDCILLLDEVDTFFSQRSRADTATNKNAMVSVFLRVLDYYNGILFLTTNRAGVLDEAFKSRIHYKIYYPDLTLEQTLDIWKLNIQRVRKAEEQLAEAEKREPLAINENDLLAFAHRRFLEGSGQRRGVGRWNGRQIRNAFQVARSLAYYEYGMQEEQLARGAAINSAGPPVLDVRHFETMHEITASFENYRAAVHGGTTDAGLALEAEYRNDNYRDPLTDGLQAEYRDDHLREAAVGYAASDRDTGLSDTGIVDPSLAGREERPRQQVFVTRQSDAAPETFAHGNRIHRGSLDSRRGSGGKMPVAGPASPPNVGPNVPGAHIHLHPQQPRYLVASPGHGPVYDAGSAARVSDPSGGYLVAGPARGGGYPTDSYSGPISMRNSGTNLVLPGSTIQGYPPDQLPQYGGNVGGMTATTPRGTSPAIGNNGGRIFVSGAGRDHTSQEYYGPAGASSPSPTGQDGFRVWTAGPAGPQSSRSPHYTGYGKEIQPGFRETEETDLSLD